MFSRYVGNLYTLYSGTAGIPIHTLNFIMNYANHIPGSFR